MLSQSYYIHNQAMHKTLVSIVRPLQWRMAKELLLLCLLLLLLHPPPCESASTSKPELVQKLSKAHFEFSLDLYRQLTLLEGGGVGNLVCSPYSAHSLLSQLFLGTSSSSDSSRQLRRALHFGAVSYVDAHTAFGEVSRSFADDRYYERKVRPANGLFAQQGTPVSAHYARALRQFYRSRLGTLDFRNADPAQTLGVVNDWVKDATEGDIPRMLQRPPAPDSKLLVVNALSVDTRWLNPFDPAKTFDEGLFFLPNGER